MLLLLNQRPLGDAVEVAWCLLWAGKVPPMLYPSITFLTFLPWPSPPLCVIQYSSGSFPIYLFSQSETIQVLATWDVAMLLERVKVEISLTILLFPIEI